MRSTTLGIPYLSKDPDHFSNVSILTVACTHIMSNILGHLMRCDLTSSHGSRILRCKIYEWKNVVDYGCLILLLWGLQLLNIGKYFYMGLSRVTTTSLLVSGKYQTDLLWIASVIHLQQTKVLCQIRYLPLMKLIIKALCIPVGASTIPVLLLTVQISSQYCRSR